MPEGTMTEIEQRIGSDDELVRFTFELGQLRAEARHGWNRIYENPESVAEHTQRAASLGYLLAHREGFKNPSLVATMILFHDAHETRTGDADKVQRKYLKLDEQGAAQHQTQGLGDAGKAIFDMWCEVEKGETEAGRLAKDAEILEMVFTARELVIRGNTDAQEWILSSRKRLKTQAARDLLEIIDKADPSEWWKRICG
jgi:putative hydrolase of HD superfamily